MRESISQNPSGLYYQALALAGLDKSDEAATFTARACAPAATGRLPPGCVPNAMASAFADSSGATFP